MKRIVMELIVFLSFFGLLAACALAWGLYKLREQQANEG